jgi:hypothetical protein
MALCHLGQGDREGGAAERLDQPGVLRVEAAQLVDDARILLLGMDGYFLDLLGRQLGRLVGDEMREASLSERPAVEPTGAAMAPCGALIISDKRRGRR